MKEISKLLLIFSIVFTACTENESTSSDTQNRISAKDLEFVGIEHNLGLSQALDYLTENKKIILELPVKERLKLLENFLIKNIDANNEYSSVSNEIGTDEIKNIFSRLDYKKSVSNSFIVDSFSSEANLYLRRLKEIVETTDIHIETIISDIRDLENEIEQSEINFTDEELVTLFSATQTAKYTCQYWVENLQYWVNLSEDDQNRCAGEDGADCYNDVVGSIAGSDVAGAIGGAAGAWVVNVVPGAGQVAYGSAIIGGAVGTSVTTAVSHFIDWLFE